MGLYASFLSWSCCVKSCMKQLSLAHSLRYVIQYFAYSKIKTVRVSNISYPVHS